MVWPCWFARTGFSALTGSIQPNALLRWLWCNILSKSALTTTCIQSPNYHKDMQRDERLLSFHIECILGAFRYRCMLKMVTFEFTCGLCHIVHAKENLLLNCNICRLAMYYVLYYHQNYTGEWPLCELDIFFKSICKIN